MNAKTTIANEAKDHLLEVLKPGDTCNTILRHVSKSGVARAISVLTSDNTDITYWVARLLDYRIDQKNGGLRVQGCGMDMGFHVVYSLARRLWPTGFDTWPGYWRNEPMTFDADGGYALRHRWL